MSLFFILVLVAIAWMMSAFIDGAVHLWHLLGMIPFWLLGAIVVGILAWLIGDS